METREATRPPTGEHHASEYVVSAVRYSSDGTHIYKVRVHRVRPGSVDPPLEILRTQLLAALEFGRTFVPVDTRRERGQQTQAALRIVRVDGQQYLRCDAQKLPADHLPGVAEF